MTSRERAAPAQGRKADGSGFFSPSNQRRRLGGGRGRGSAPGCLDSNARREPQGRRRRRSERRARCPLAPGRGMSGGEEAEAEPGAGGAIPAAPSPPAEEGDTRQRYEELCSSLNMDERARSEAWLSYQSMKRNYTLEVRAGPGGGAEGRGRHLLSAEGARPAVRMGGEEGVGVTASCRHARPLRGSRAGRRGGAGA